MARKPYSHYMLVAIFLLFIAVIGATVLVPNATAAATAQVDGLPIALLWALPVMAIVAFIMYISHKSICAGKNAA